MSKVTKALDVRDEKLDRNSRSDHFGQVISVTTGIAMVRIAGSPTSVPCIVPAGLQIQSGDRVTLSRVGHRLNQWQVGSVERQYIQQSSMVAVMSNESNAILKLPQNIQALPSLFNSVVVTWDAVHTHPNISFEVQYSFLGINGPYTTALITKGSSAIIASTQTTWTRIRSLNDSGITTAWSEPIETTPIEVSVDSVPPRIVGLGNTYTVKNNTQVLVRELEVFGELTVESTGALYIG